MIELLVVVLILGVIGALALGRFTGVSQQAKMEAAKGDLTKIFKAVMGDEKSGHSGFYNETRTPAKIPVDLRYLLSQDFLEAAGVTEDVLVWDPNHKRGYRDGGYLRGQNVAPDGSLLDPWGHPYLIQHPTATGVDPEWWESRIVSAGPNGSYDLTEAMLFGEPDYAPGDDLVLHFFQ